MLKTLKGLALAAGLIAAPLAAQAATTVIHHANGNTTVIHHGGGYGYGGGYGHPYYHAPIVYAHPYGIGHAYGYHQHCSTYVQHGLFGARPVTHCY